MMHCRQRRGSKKQLQRRTMYECCDPLSLARPATIVYLQLKIHRGPLARSSIFKFLDCMLPGVQ